MNGQGRPLAIVLLLLAWPVARAGAVVGDPVDALRQDAQLAAVAFVDPQCGWAVGDRGTIWHTADGGEHWTLQTSGVECRLSAVQFVDRKNGWAAGGFTQPYTHVTTGVLLRTRDGGEHWTHDAKLLLPAVLRIKFFDMARGCAITSGSPLFPSCVFTTEDGGRSWSALPPGESDGWLVGDFIDQHTGVLAGRNSSLASVRRRAIEPAANVDFGLRSARRLKLAGESRGWLVGDGGLVMTTEDQGHSWQLPAEDIPRGVAEQFDFAALEVHGDRAWIAGSPGTRVLHTSDGGRTWQAFATQQNLPIRDLSFCDDDNGWTVGDLGTILATRDGGRSWQRQRGGGTRAALLGFYSQPKDVPIELLARLSADEGYLGLVEIVNRSEATREMDRVAQPADLAHEAAVATGASGSWCEWRFPLRPAGLNHSDQQIVDQWNRANDGRGLERLDAHLVAQIRTWRPNVIFTMAGGAKQPDPVGRLINQAVLRAVQRAADEKWYPEQVADAGLAPWRTQKVYASASAGELGTTSIDTAQLAVRLGVSLADVAATARGMLSEQYEPAPTTLGFRLLVDHLPQEQGQRDFFAGIALRPGGDARRLLREPADQNIDGLRRSAQARRNLQAILARADQQDGGESRYLAEVGEATKNMSDGHVAEVLYQLAQRYHRSGRWELAAETYEMLTERAPNHPLAGAALVWLAQYYASGEAAWRAGRQQQGTVQQVSAQAPFIAPASTVADASWGATAGLSSSDGADEAQGQTERSTVVPAGGITAAAQIRKQRSLVTDRRGNEDRFAKAAVFVHKLEQLQPSMSADPAVRFALAAAQRNSGVPRQAERFYLGLRRSRGHDAWWACAEGEHWLSQTQGVPSKGICNCARIAARPHLDGKLDDLCWRTAHPVELHSPQRDDEEWSAVALMAYDAEFLYLAVSCRQAPDFKYESSTSPRPRDADLSNQDRVEVYLDIDRDWGTYYKLTVDHRGWTGEAFWNDTTWNPNWFVAAATTDGVWTAEAAIPLVELAPQAPDRRQVWGLGVQRIVPGVGFQSWTTPATPEVVPQGFGYLIFE